MSLTFGSLFAGIGGFDLGFERAGMQCKWQVEIDHYANKVLAKHWPNVRRHDDIRTFPPADGTDWSVDVICGGFPCQDISRAGKGGGINGARSGLFHEAMRVVRVLRPRFIVLENSPALLDSGLGVVLGTMAAIGLNARWFLLPAGAVGAPPGYRHFRCRLFVIGFTGLAFSDPNPWTCKFEDWREHGRERSEENRQTEWDVYRQGREPRVPRVANGVPDYVDRLGCLGNAVVPQVAQYIAERILEAQ